MNMSEPANQLLAPSYSRWLHSGVVTALGRQIVGGSFQPGDVLNMERPEGELSVSRSVLWEAVRVLSAKGLLEARPKSAAPLCALHQNGTCSTPMSWCGRFAAAETSNTSGIRKKSSGHRPQVVRLAAIRRTEKDLVAMRTALERLSETSGAARRTAADYVTTDLRFHHAILVATRNDLLAQLGAIMENALKQRDALVHRGGVNQDPSFLEHHWSVFGAIGEQDEDGAERAARPGFLGSREGARLKEQAAQEVTWPSESYGIREFPQ